MIINDQIRNKKLLYDLNREAAKISALSSSRIQKYEYLTDEDILPSNRQQIIKQAKFTYSPLAKAFEKQIKTITDQGEKQIDALETLKDTSKQAVNVNDDYKDKLLRSKGREIFRKICNKSLDKIEELIKKIDGNNLIFTILSTGGTYDFTGKNYPLSLLSKIRNGETTIEKAKELQKELNNNIKKLRKGNKNQEQRKALANLIFFLMEEMKLLNFMMSILQ